MGFDYIRGEGKAHRIASQLIAVAAKGDSGRIYISPDEDQVSAAFIQKPSSYPSGELHGKSRVNVGLYGFNETSDLFTNRQLVALMTFSELVAEARAQVEADGGSAEYAQAVSVYLAFLIDKMADLGNSLNRWEPNAQCPRQLFARQAIPMIWSYAESNPFSASSGSWDVLLNNLMRSFESSLFDFDRRYGGKVLQADAQENCYEKSIMISTDPPYYDNIGYADIADFFYVWLRKNLQGVYPELFKTILVPKAEELVATPYRFDGNKDKAKHFFEEGMLNTFVKINQSTRNDIPVTIYYAFKQHETDINDDIGRTVSTGWESMLSAIIHAGFCITGTWPIRTEMGSRANGQNSNALASSIVLVCRKRPADAPICTRRDFLTALKRELRPALVNLQQSNIAPVDMAQSAIGPGMAVYSRYAQVLEADGTPMTVRTALQIINQELDQYFSEQEGELDRDTIFCVALYTQYAFREVKFGDVDVLARAKNTSTDRLREKGILYAERGTVRLLQRDEMASQRTYDVSVTWQVVQRLAHALDVDGVEGAAQIVVGLSSEDAEKARALAYRLFQTAERRGWAQEAYAYNTLVTNWRAIQEVAARIKKEQGANQGGLFAE